ncbi:hypothetical protein L9F63_007665, partial [Diploptera punctata]
SELARQNRITQQILAQYLQRRLFPHLTTTTTPSPPALLRPRDTQKDHHAHHHQAHDADGDDRLETVESEQISNVYFTSEDIVGTGPDKRGERDQKKINFKFFYQLKIQAAESDINPRSTNSLSSVLPTRNADRHNTIV